MDAAGNQVGLSLTTQTSTSLPEHTISAKSQQQQMQSMYGGRSIPAQNGAGAGGTAIDHHFQIVNQRQQSVQPQFEMESMTGISDHLQLKAMNSSQQAPSKNMILNQANIQYATRDGSTINT